MKKTRKDGISEDLQDVFDAVKSELKKGETSDVGEEVRTIVKRVGDESQGLVGVLTQIRRTGADFSEENGEKMASTAIGQMLAGIIVTVCEGNIDSSFGVLKEARRALEYTDRIVSKRS